MLEALQAFNQIVSNLRYDLYRQLKDRPSYRFLSISLEIETVDPLAVLQGIIPTHPPFFYDVCLLSFKRIKVMIVFNKALINFFWFYFKLLEGIAMLNPFIF